MSYLVLHGLILSGLVFSCRVVSFLREEDMCSNTPAHLINYRMNHTGLPSLGLGLRLRLEQLVGRSLGQGQGEIRLRVKG